jgi:hypothetical protein
MRRLLRLTLLAAALLALVRLRRQRSRDETPTVDIEEATRDELYETAKKLDIEGRSKMTKDELHDAIEERAETPPGD